MTSSISAIARTVVKEIVRMRMLMFFVLLAFLSMTIFFAMWLGVGSGRPDEKVQTFLSYSVSGITLILSFTTIFLSVATVTRDIKRREIFTIATKPISRTGYLVGKFMGITVFNIFMLVLGFALVYGTSLYMASKELEGLSVDEKAYFQSRIDSLVFTARKGVFPQMPGTEQQIVDIVEQQLADQIKRYPEVTAQPQLIESWRADLTAAAKETVKSGFLTVPCGGYKVFKFTNIKVRPGDDAIFIRYKMDVSYNPDNLKVFCQWAIGPTDPTLNKTVESFGGEELIRTFHEQKVPASLVSKDGELFVAFRNPFENGQNSILFPDKGGLEVLYTAGSYEANMLRSLALVLMRMVFLAILSLTMGACFGFPVAVLVVMFFFVLGITSSFISEAVEFGSGETAATAINSFMSIIPELAKIDPAVFLEKARLVEPALVIECLIWLVLVKGGIYALLGIIVFRNRELARVIV